MTMTKCPHCNSTNVAVMSLGESFENIEQFSQDMSYNAVCGECSNRFVSEVAPNKETKMVLTKEQIEDLELCRPLKYDGDKAEALEAFPDLLDTCKALLNERERLTEALSNALAHMCGVPLPLNADDIRAQATKVPFGC